MKKSISLFLAVTLALILTACGSADHSSVPDTAGPDMISLPLATEELSSVSGFSDVPVDAWYAEAVAWCRENGIMSGTAADAKPIFPYKCQQSYHEAESQKVRMVRCRRCGFGDSSR